MWGPTQNFGLSRFIGYKQTDTHVNYIYRCLLCKCLGFDEVYGDDGTRLRLCIEPEQETLSSTCNSSV